MRILVAGGAGYIGSHTIVELYNSGHSVVCVDNLYNAKISAIKNVEKIVKYTFGDSAFNDFEVDYSLVEEFEKVFSNRNIPIIEIITDENRDYLLKLSKEMRNSIRGKDIGGLG